MTRLIHRLLLKCPPEIAHHCVIALLKVKQFLRFRVRGGGLPPGPAIHVPAIPRLSFPSRVGLAAGFDKNAEVFAALSTMGFGFIEVGTVTPFPQPGNPKPRIWRLPNQALRNQLGFNNVGIDRFVENVDRYRKLVSVPLFANIGKGKDTPIERATDDYVACAEALKDRVDGFVVNVSSPNTPGLRDLQNDAFLEKLAGLLPKGVVVLLKLAPDLPNAEIERLAALVSETDRYAGMVLTNTSRQLAESLAGAATGGLSGRPLFERSRECVAIARSHLGAKLLIGVGGISSVLDANRMREAGADLIEVYSAFIYQGPSLIRKLAADLV